MKSSWLDSCSMSYPYLPYAFWQRGDGGESSSRSMWEAFNVLTVFVIGYHCSEIRVLSDLIKSTLDIMPVPDMCFVNRSGRLRETFFLACERPQLCGTCHSDSIDIHTIAVPDICVFRREVTKKRRHRSYFLHVRSHPTKATVFETGYKRSEDCRSPHLCHFRTWNEPFCWEELFCHAMACEKLLLEPDVEVLKISLKVERPCPSISQRTHLFTRLPAYEGQLQRFVQSDSRLLERCVPCVLYSCIFMLYRSCRKLFAAVTSNVTSHESWFRSRLQILTCDHRDWQHL